MKVGVARAKAQEWIAKHASLEPGFCGAYFSGSTVGMSDDAELAAASDIDVVVITSDTEPALKLGKFIYEGALIEVTYLSSNDIASAEEVLASYHLAGSFRMNTIIADPTGHLSKLQAEVSDSFNKRLWVDRRCENVRLKIENGLRSINPSAPLHDLVQSWLFPTGVTTHLILVAALRNPTVRKRYAAAREVLSEYGLAHVYPELLALLGCTHLTSERIEHHLDELTSTFDAAAAVAQTPFFFSTDITASARPIAIDGSRELIRSGLHHEAVFWIVATFARCHKILAADASTQLQLAHRPAFEAIISDLGFTSTGDFIPRAEGVLQYLPRLMDTVETILHKNPAIRT
ncbi:hypothetical protein [Paenibacillus spongiae]|uniref:Nucleotidyltransferase domain-containing protein n=1 Tax=Paenibacillus spongiae TaxID=2909671 RepID=A0ABY5SHB2_9BACL|nr:hypothetical protein [Paenibacillus spongiae]UVI33154.1 hypothetical protein L1F29_15510 [Paenibacillus spongiae]